MNMNGTIRRCAAWLAFMAILFAALVPSVSRAMAPAGDSGWTEICTMQGAKFVKVGDDGGQPSGDSAQHLEHCPFCFTQHDTVGLPPTPALTLHHAAGSAIYPPLFYQAPRRLFIWSAAQSRAPPAHS
ncbi:DUF2946 domain-containing protein [Massilia sp. erpn]|nr:DUF2946 domain-containing protein [Massilia sp. erpn]